MPFAFYLAHSGRSYSSDRYSLFGKRSLAIAAMNVELPPFKNGEHNSKGVSILDCGLTPLSMSLVSPVSLCFSAAEKPY